MEAVIVLTNVIGRAPVTAAPTNTALSSIIVSNGVTGYTNQTASSAHRMALMITAYSAPVYVIWSELGATPSVAASSTCYDAVIPAGSSLMVNVRRSIDAYVTSTGNVSAVELQ